MNRPNGLGHAGLWEEYGRGDTVLFVIIKAGKMKDKNIKKEDKGQYSCAHGVICVSVVQVE